MAAVLAAAMTVGLGATPAGAAVSWQIEPGGPFSGQAATLTIHDPNTGTNVVCEAVTISGELQSGTVAGPGAGTITSANLSHCYAANGSPFDLEPGDLPWGINLSTTQPNGTQPSGTISGIQILVTGPVCKGFIQGQSTDPASGSVPFDFVNKTDELQFLNPGSNLRTSGLSSCTGFFLDGDAIQASGNFVLTPSQTIGSS